MYDNVKLEKGLYNLSNKTFVEALEEQDHSEDYVGTPLENLDAYERQLKRFDIKVSGPHCDKVEKFFSTTETAVLFPEYLKRYIVAGIEDSKLGDIIAVKTFINSTIYRGVYMSDTSNYSDVSVGSVMPDCNIYESTDPTYLVKTAKTISCPYEVVRQQNLDIFGIHVRAIGKNIGNALYSKAISTISSSAKSISSSSSTLAYSDIVNLFSQFSKFNMNTLIVSPTNFNNILNMSQVSDRFTINDDKEVILPFGTKLISNSNVDDKTIIAIDREYALEYITSTDIFIEPDKIVNRQLDRLAISINYAFKPILSDAMKKLTIINQ